MIVNAQWHKILCLHRFSEVKEVYDYIAEKHRYGKVCKKCGKIEYLN